MKMDSFGCRQREVTMSDDEWVTVGNRKSAREGIDTRKKEGSVPQTYMGSANNSSQYERERRSAYWEEVRAQQEAEAAARERQRQIEYQRSTRNTEANFPSLVRRPTTTDLSPAPVLSYQLASVREPAPKRDRLEEDDVYIPPIEIRVRKSRISMVDERPEYLRVPSVEEDLDAKYAGLELLDPDEEAAEWEEFELNTDLGIVGRQFDL
jgi:hypothetical protein